MVQQRPPVAKCGNCTQHYFGYCSGKLHWRERRHPDASPCSEYQGEGAIPKPKPQLPRQFRRIEQRSLSNWKLTENNQCYKVSTWEVEEDSGSLYQLTWDMRFKHPKCHCQEFEARGHCYHSDAVKAKWQDWQEWSAAKNADDLAREMRF